jgi:hypothetical protein
MRYWWKSPEPEPAVLRAQKEGHARQPPPPSARTASPKTQRRRGGRFFRCRARLPDTLEMRVGTCSWMNFSFASRSFTGSPVRPCAAAQRSEKHNGGGAHRQPRALSARRAAHAVRAGTEHTRTRPRASAHAAAVAGECMRVHISAAACVSKCAAHRHRRLWLVLHHGAFVRHGLHHVGHIRRHGALAGRHGGRTAPASVLPA